MKARPGMAVVWLCLMLSGFLWLSGCKREGSQEASWEQTDQRERGEVSEEKSKDGQSKSKTRTAEGGLLERDERNTRNFGDGGTGDSIEPAVESGISRIRKPVAESGFHGAVTFTIEFRSNKARQKPGESLGQLIEPNRMVLETEEGVYEAFPSGDGSMGILVPSEFVKQVLEISVLEYPDSRIVLQQEDIRIELRLESRRIICRMNEKVLECAPFRKDGVLYLPLEAICENFGYYAEMKAGSYRLCLKSSDVFKKRKLPKTYDYRKSGRSSRIRNQGPYGTCWSFAALTALETALLPENAQEFSADHMSLHNSFSLNQQQGGQYTMAMAYLLGWQGPVLEAEDPYGDGISPDGLKPAVHVQEIQILPDKDYEAIKKAVFLEGGVQSSLYTSITSSNSQSVFFNQTKNAYCYQGKQAPNHDVVIVGWDDTYPKENFQEEPEGDGAFLCASSWGEAFGEKGYFYVSYYDSNIGRNNVVYTGIENADNYNSIYQSDLCGWVGQVGYGQENAYGSNIYQAREEEYLEAVGFYATGNNMSYEISLVHHAANPEDFKDRKVIARGTAKYSGFYTVPLKFSEKLESGERFAVILEARTPGNVHPIAVEYRADEATAEADITDGEGYISPDGRIWESVEDNYQCNVCLKGYTSIKAARLLKPETDGFGEADG